MKKKHLKKDRKFKITVSFVGTEEEAELAYSLAIRALLDKRY